MSFIVYVLITLAAAAALALLALEDPGYVLISRTPYEIEVSLALAVVLAGILLFAVYLVLRLLWAVLRMPRTAGRWRVNRRHALATQATLAGYSRLIEGEWEEAEEILSQRLGYGATPLLSALGAAYAAQQRADYDARDKYLSVSYTHLTLPTIYSV